MGPMERTSATSKGNPWWPCTSEGNPCWPCTSEGNSCWPCTSEGNSCWPCTSKGNPCWPCTSKVNPWWSCTSEGNRCTVDVPDLAAANATHRVMTCQKDKGNVHPQLAWRAWRPTPSERCPQHWPCSNVEAVEAAEQGSLVAVDDAGCWLLALVCEGNVCEMWYGVASAWAMITLRYAHVQIRSSRTIRRLSKLKIADCV
jgi:hypothetical protein